MDSKCPNWGTGGDAIIRYLLIFALVTGIAGAASAQSPPVFRNLTVDDGLPDNTVRAIIQDRRGFVWLGTQGGLVRFDGREMRVHLPAEGDSTSIVGRLVASLLEDSRGRIWVGTILNGLCRYDPATERYTRFVGGPEDTTRIPPTWIRNLAEDKQGRIWVTTIESRVYRVDPETGAATTILPGPGWPAEVAGQSFTDIVVDASNQVWVTTRTGEVHVMDVDGSRLDVLDFVTAQSSGGLLSAAEGLYEAPDGRIWIAGYGGLLVWDPRSREIGAYVPQPFDSSSGRNHLIRVAADPSGVMWLGSEAGLQRFDPRYDQFTLYEYDADAGNSPVQGPTVSVVTDAAGMIWAGTWQGGVSRFEPSGSFFRTHRHDPDRVGSLHADPVMTVHRDRDGVLWVGTGTPTAGPVVGGLNRVTADGTFFEHIELPRPDLHVVESIAEAADDRLWIGTNRGLWIYDRATGDFTQHRPGDPELAQQASNSIRSMLAEPDGSLWLGTRDYGLFRLNADGSLARHYSPDPDEERGLGGRSVMCLLRDSSNRLWVGTSTAGLRRYVPETDDFEQFNLLEGDLLGVSDIVETADGRLWIANLGGLGLFDPESGRVVRTLTIRDGLPNDRISTLLQDGRGRLWLSTARGLTLFDPATGTLRTFDIRDGLPRNEAGFNALMDSDGTAYLPSSHGLITFRPDQFTPSPYESQVVLTGLKLFDERLQPGPDSPLASNVTSTRAVDLDHDQNVLEFSFASLDFRRPDLLRYRYRLQGQDPDWRPASSATPVTYTNLAPGRYVFEVQGTNRDGVWSPHTASLAVRVRHPWWASPLAYAVYAVLFLLLLGLVFRTLLRRARHAQLLRLRLAEVEKLEELDRVKSRFFANISHEFRTPLTLIEGMLHRHRDKPEILTAENREMIFRNTRRLRELVDQLLDLARLESGSLTLKWQNDDVVGFIGAVSSPFAHVAEARGIRYEVEIPAGEVRGWFDRGVVETVVANLLSNAMKYTPDGESVNLRVTVGDEHPLPADVRDRVALVGDVSCRDLRIVVANSGTYITPEDRNRVFDRFIMAASESMDGNVGSGVGLALVKELVELLGGTAEVTSEPGHETAFTVTVPVISTPMADAVAATEEIDPDREARRRIRAVDDSVAVEVGDADDGVTVTDGAPDQPLVLVVEDHADLRAFLAGELGGDYRVVTAGDGVEGLAAAREHVPDLVVSDVMMPNMDGFEMLTRLKEDGATDHVPVVLLTAKAEAESRKEGLKIGADDYLAKPLDPEELRIRVANLIRQRALLRNKYSSNIDLLPVRDLPMVSRDDRFLAQALQVLDEHLEDEDFGVEIFAREVGLSRTQLHRKLKALTGRSASSIIRRQRLRRAAELLASGFGSVAEVAFTVGFKSLSHFSKNFKDEFGVVPSRYGKDGDETDS